MRCVHSAGTKHNKGDQATASSRSLHPRVDYCGQHRRKFGNRTNCRKPRGSKYKWNDIQTCLKPGSTKNQIFMQLTVSQSYRPRTLTRVEHTKLLWILRWTGRERPAIQIHSRKRTPVEDTKFQRRTCFRSTYLCGPRDP